MQVTSGTMQVAKAPCASAGCFRSRQSPTAACPSMQAPATQFSHRCSQSVRCSRPATLSRRAAVRVQATAWDDMVEVKQLAAGEGVAAQPSPAWDPPAVSITKRKFLEAYPKPVPGIYDAVLQELLVQQHLIRYNKKYQYNPVSALGFVSVFDQVLEGLPTEEQDAIFKAYVGALDEDAGRYRRDAEAWESWAKGLSGAEELKPDDSGSEQQKTLAAIGSRFSNKEEVYTKFLAIGLFRLLELGGAKDPKALEGLVTALNVRTSAVNRDLLTYKGVLSKLSAAKELMKEILAREKKKTAEREAAKADLGNKGEPAEPADALEGKVDRATA